MNKKNSFNNEGKLERWWESKVAFLFASIIPLIIGISFIYSIKTDLAVDRQVLSDVKNNDLTHFELELQDTNSRLNSLQLHQEQLQNDMTKVLTILASKKY